MKIDRFVKVMLVLIALLLALNCVSNFSNTSNSSGNSSGSPGSSGTRTPGSSRTPLIEKTVEAAPPPTQYRAITVAGSGYDPNAVQVALNQQSAQGWEYVGSYFQTMIFKK